MSEAAAAGWGRRLFLCTDPALVREQLAGRDLARAEAGTLRDDISTDEITPVSYTHLTLPTKRIV